MIDDDRRHSRDPRFTVWVCATGILFLAALAVGFVWLPSAQRDIDKLSLWGAICRAVGLPYGLAQASAGLITGQPSSAVAWTVDTRQRLKGGDAVRGAARAQVCNNCHGAKGVSDDAAIPNLAGQSAAAIYKQLEDFKDGRRSPVVMGVFVAPLSSAVMVDIATYYASMPGPGATAIAPGPSYPAARRLTEFGEPMRSVASCAACHGPLGLVSGAPELRGQQRAYLEQQMQAFKTGIRHNDVDELMRGVARQLTQAEIAMLAAFYSGFSRQD